MDSLVVATDDTLDGTGEAARSERLRDAIV